MQSNDLNRLAAATNEHLAQYSSKRNYWHGVNIVALRIEEERRGLPPRRGESTSQPTEEVLKNALAENAKPGADQWPLATASEACLALHVITAGSEWCDKAELWLHRLLNHPATDPFSIESYSRQLRENGTAIRSPPLPAQITSSESCNGMWRAPSNGGRSILS